MKILFALGWADLLDGLMQAITDLFWLIYKSFSWIGEHVMSFIITAASTAFPTVPWGSVQQHLDRINFFFPLNETITMVTGLLSLWLAMWSYRMVKSWIPTESS